MDIEKIDIKKHDIVYVKVGTGARGSMQKFDRPAIILQNNVGNQFSPTTIVAFMTSKIKRKDLPTHVVLDDYNMHKKSMVLLEQVATIPKSDIILKIDRLREPDQMRVDAAMLVSLGVITPGRK